MKISEYENKQLPETLKKANPLLEAIRNCPLEKSFLVSGPVYSSVRAAIYRVMKETGQFYLCKQEPTGYRIWRVTEQQYADYPGRRKTKHDKPIIN